MPVRRFFFFVDGYDDFGDRGITKLPAGVLGILFLAVDFFSVVDFFVCRFFLFGDFLLAFPGIENTSLIAVDTINRGHKIVMKLVRCGF